MEIKTKEYISQTFMFRSSRPEVTVKRVFSEISQNSQENACAKVSFLIKLQASGLQHY